MATRSSALFLMTFAVLVAACMGADTITDPTEDPREAWHYGTGSNSQTITFSFTEPPSLSSYTIAIVNQENPGEEYFSKNYIAPVSNPCTTNITVPDPGTNEDCLIKIKLFPMSLDPARDIPAREVAIQKP